MTTKESKSEIDFGERVQRFSSSSLVRGAHGRFSTGAGGLT